MTSLAAMPSLDDTAPNDLTQAVLAAWNRGESKRSIAKRLDLTAGRVGWIVDSARKAGKRVCGHLPVVEILPPARIADGMLCLFASGFDTAEIAVICRMQQAEVTRMLDWRRDAMRAAKATWAIERMVSA